MTSLDTIEFTTNSDYIKSLDLTNFSMSNIEKPNGLKFTNYTLINKPIGINKITINDLYETVRIKASSKCLGSNYVQGISNNTLEQFVKEVNKTGLELESNFIYNCSVNYSDVKNDLKLTNNVNEYLNTLNQLTATKFFKTNYDTSIVFKEKIKTQPIRLTGYSKEHEIKQTVNKAFYNNFPQIVNSLDNLLRIESRLPNKATVKKYFKSTDLIDILNTSNINYQILNKIINNQTNFNPNINLQEMSNTEEKNLGQIFLLNNYYNGNYDRIIQHIKNKYGANTKITGLSKKVKDYLAIINNANENYSIENIEEIRTALKN